MSLNKTSLRNRIRNWWQVRSGQDETPLDGGTPFWVLSFFFHLILLVALATIFISPRQKTQVSMVIPAVSQTMTEEVTPQVDFNMDQNEDIGSDENLGFESAMAEAPTIDDSIEVAEEYDLTPHDFGEIAFDEYVPQPVAIEVSRLPVNGNAGFATTGADGAIDRITHEILLSLEERKTLVVWMFDQSASLLRQREEILDRFDNIYSELATLEEKGSEHFKKRELDDEPLLTQVYAFGSQYGPMLKQPTNQLGEIKTAVRDIPVDESGLENVFSAVNAVGNKYKHLRKVHRRTRERERNVMIVIISDEAGDDINVLDSAVDICKTNEIPVYVVGVPAPFGRKETFVKYVDPDPNFDQSVQWLPVSQGPESVAPERIRLNYSTRYEEEIPIDSGFGPFALTRLCFETGGTYFTVHPNRQNTGRRVNRGETEEYSAYFQRFFDPKIMRRYRPDYVSTQHYIGQIQSNECRLAVVQAARESWTSPMSPPQLRFEKLDEARFVNQVNAAQQPAALVSNKINRLYEILKMGEIGRESEVSLRWKAGYDLAMGRVLAVKIRAESYNKLLAMLKTKSKFENEKNNVWVLKPANEILTGSATEKLADKARMYLQRVVDEHPGTPWALLAKRELQQPIGWALQEEYREPPRPREPRPQANVPRPNNPMPRQMERPMPKTKRTPKL